MSRSSPHAFGPERRRTGAPPGFRRLRIGGASILVRASDLREALALHPIARAEGHRWQEDT
jgi:hypothetical protein